MCKSQKSKVKGCAESVQSLQLVTRSEATTGESSTSFLDVMKRSRGQQGGIVFKASITGSPGASPPLRPSDHRLHAAGRKRTSGWSGKSTPEDMLASTSMSGGPVTRPGELHVACSFILITSP